MPALPLFVSSTFSDFQGERDVLAGPVRQRLDEALARFGCRVEMVDLRWGVDTTTEEERAAHRLVLEVCLNEINRSRPLFLGMVGGRYGSIPDEAHARWVAEHAGVASTQSLSGLSISAIEMGHGGLWRGTPGSAPVFLLRDLAGAEEPRWMDADPELVAGLRSSIETAALERRCSVTEYQARLTEDAVDLAAVEVEGLTSTFEDLAYGLLLPPLLQRAGQRGVALNHDAISRLAAFREDRLVSTGRADLIQSLVDQVRSGSRILLHGESGSGKSTVLIGVQSRLEADETPFACFVAGLKPGEQNEVAAIKVLARQVNERLMNPASVPLMGSLSEIITWWQSFLVDAVRELGSLALLVDALDQLPPTDGSEPTFLSVVPPGVSVLATSTRPGESRWLGRSGYQFRSLGPLSREAAREALVAWARAAGGRTLPPAPLGILSSTERQPIWVRMAIDWLVGLGSEDFARVSTEGSPGLAISRLLEEESVALPRDATELAALFLSRTAKRVGDTNAGLLLAWLSASRSGLAPADLASLLSAHTGDATAAELNVARLRRALGSQLHEVDDAGRLAFSHTLIREAAGKYANQETHSQIGQYLIALPDLDIAGRLDAIWHLLLSADPQVDVDAERAGLLAKSLRDTPPSAELGQVIASAISTNQGSFRLVLQLDANELGPQGLAALNASCLHEIYWISESVRAVLTGYIAHLAEQVAALPEPSPAAQKTWEMLEEVIRGIARESSNEVEIERNFVSGRIIPQLCASHEAAGRAAFDAGDMDAAREHFERGLDLLERSRNEDPEFSDDLLIGFYCGVAETHEARNEFDEAAQFYENAVRYSRLTVARRQTSSARRELSACLDGLARAKHGMGLLAEAASLFKESLGVIVALRQEGEKSIVLERDYSVSLDNIARVSWLMGEEDAARNYYTEALEVTRRLAEWQPDKPEAQLDLVDAHRNLAAFEHAAGRTDATIQHLSEASDVIHPWAFVSPNVLLLDNYGSLLLELADLQTAQGNGRLVRDISVRAMRMYERAAELTDDGRIRLQLALACLKLGMHLARFRSQFLQPDPQFGKAFEVLADLLKDDPDLTEANSLMIGVIAQWLACCDVHPRDRVQLLLLSRRLHAKLGGGGWEIDLLRSLLTVDRELLQHSDDADLNVDPIRAEIDQLVAVLARHAT